MLDKEGETIAAINTYNLDANEVDLLVKKGDGLSWEVIEQKKTLLLEDYCSLPQARKR